ncbi:MAG: fatty acid desaturase [Planctomycetota bacterium]
MSSTLSNRFSIPEAKSLVKDLNKPNPKIYWIDFLSTIIVGHTAFAAMDRVGLFLQGPALYAIQLGLFTLVAILYMRAAMFIHELVHLPRQGFTAFRVTWNLLCGIPFLIPSFLYYPHVDHHRRKHYGTDRDGEYLDLSHRHPANLALFVVAALVVPVAAFMRFLVMTPIAWVFPPFRNWVEKRASSMIIDIFYLRGDFGKEAHKIMRMQEVLCFLWCASFGTFGLLQGGIPLIKGYCVAVVLIVINNVRTLGAHRWTGDGRELTFEEQLVDTADYPHRPWFTELWGPVGTRYHATHHLFPSMPYHNLGIAHRRLMENLPPDSLYRDVVRLSLTSSIVELWRRAANRKNVKPEPAHLASATSEEEEKTAA